MYNPELHEMRAALTESLAKENPKHIQAMKDGKAPLEYLVTSANAGEARVLKSGADKYGVRNWLVDKILATTYVAAIRRHLDDWAEGLNKDMDSGEHPLQHIRACCAIVMDAEKHDTLIDDRGRAESIDKGGSPATRDLPERWTPVVDPLDVPITGTWKFQNEPLYIVTYTDTQASANGLPLNWTKTFGPFVGFEAAREFIEETRGQIAGVASINTLTPVQEIENVRDRDQEVNSGDNGADGSDAHGEVTLGAERAGEGRSSEPNRNETAEYLQQARKHASTSPLEVK